MGGVNPRMNMVGTRANALRPTVTFRTTVSDSSSGLSDFGAHTTMPLSARRYPHTPSTAFVRNGDRSLSARRTADRFRQPLPDSGRKHVPYGKMMLPLGP